MDNQIKNIRLKFECPADWDAMKLVDGGKYCQHCQKKVYDFTDAKQQQFLALLAENNNSLCGRFRADQMAVKNPVLAGWKKWASAAMVLIGINIFDNKAVAQASNPDTVKDGKTTASQQATFGDISMQEREPEFPGSYVAFKKFIQSHLRKIDGTSGKRAILSFIIEEDGSLTDITVVRGINEKADNEAIRVMRLSPKWKPGIRNGKNVRVAYNVPIGFE